MAYKSKITWSVRIEPELKERLIVIAKAEDRSLNNIIERFLSYMAEYYEKSPIHPIDDLLTCYHEAQWSDAFGPEYDKKLEEALRHDRKAQQQKLSKARKSD
jgi:hypothetical protein